MALTVISAPNALPTNTGDYVQQNELIAAGFQDPDKVFKIDFDNDEIVKGSIINIGGTIVRADIAEAISGTASDFVKIDATTYLASYVSSLSGVAWNNVYNGYYDTGSPANIYIFDELKAFYEGDVTTRNLATSQAVVSGIKNILRITLIDANISNSSATGFQSAIAGLSSNRVALVDSGGNLETWDINGDTWVQVGNSLLISSVSANSMTALDSSTIVMVDSGNDRIAAYAFDGTDWSLLGTPLSIASLVGSVTTFTSSRIVIADIFNDVLQVYDFNGSTFSQVGNDTSIGAVGVTKITALDTTDIAYLDTTNNDLRTYRFNGTVFNQIGNDLNIPSVATFDIAAFDSENILLTDNALDTVSNFNFDGTDWLETGTIISLSYTGSPAASRLDSNNISFIEPSIGIKTYRRIV